MMLETLKKNAFSKIIIVVLIVMLLLSVVINRRVEASITQVTANIVDDASELVQLHVEEYIEPLSLFDEFMQILWVPTDDFEGQALKLEALARQIVSHYPQIASVQIGNEAGDFVMYRQFIDQSTHTKLVMASKDQPTTAWRYFEGDFLSTIESEPGTDFDPRVRPWYIGAKETGSLYFSEPYVFFTEQIQGITAARPIYIEGKFWGVYSFDIRLSDMLHFLNDLDLIADGAAFIVTENRDVIAGSDIAYFEVDPASGIKKMPEAYWQAIEAGKINEIQWIDQNDEDHLVMYRTLETGFNKSWLVGVIINKTKFDSTLYLNMRFAGVLTALVLFLALLMLHYKYREDKMKAELEQMAKFDQLTSLMNRHSIDEVYHLLKEAYETKAQPFSIILGDIDHFKSINDTYGHTVGDEVLSELSSVIKKQLRQSDYACRWGGEEFLIVLSNSQADQACQVADKIRRKVSSYVFFTSVGEITCTLSFGVAEYNITDQDDWICFINRADEKLYMAKSLGRNQTMC